MKRTILICAALLTLAASPLVRAEDEQPLTDEYIASIKAGCSEALQGMVQVQRTEAVTRVNRGSEYEDILRLLAAFNSRAALNKLDAPELVSLTAQLQAKFSNFQRDYLSYANKLDATLKIDCKQAPVTFYDSLNATRANRASVAADVKAMVGLLDQYEAALDTLNVSPGQQSDGAHQ